MSGSEKEEKKRGKRMVPAQEKNFQFYKNKFAKKHSDIKELLRGYAKMDSQSDDIESARLSYNSSSQQEAISKFNSYSDEI